MNDLPTAEPAPPERRVIFLARSCAELIRRHRLVATLVAVTFAAVLCQAVWFGKLPQRLAFLGAVVASAGVVDLLLARPRPTPLPVRRPRLELAVATVCLVLALVFLLMRFGPAPPPYIGWPARLFLVVGVLCVLNLPVALMDLLGLRYRFGDLGYHLNGRGLRAVPVILLCFYGLGWLTGAHCTLLPFIQEQGSVWRALFTAVFIAPLPEEFFRRTWQTRLGAVTRNPAAAWLLTAGFWAALHAPIFHAGETTWTPALLNCLNLIPLGLLWGYVLHRTRSQFPSLLLHGFNFSGLQNF